MQTEEMQSFTMSDLDLLGFTFQKWVSGAKDADFQLLPSTDTVPESIRARRCGIMLLKLSLVDGLVQDTFRM